MKSRSSFRLVASSLVLGATALITLPAAAQSATAPAAPAVEKALTTPAEALMSWYQAQVAGGGDRPGMDVIGEKAKELVEGFDMSTLDASKIGEQLVLIQFVPELAKSLGARALEVMDFSKMGLDEVASNMQLADALPVLRAPIRTRVSALASTKDASGARASMMTALLAEDGDNAAVTAALKSTMAHPGFAELAKSQGGEIVGMLSTLNPEAVKPVGPQVAGLASTLLADITPQQLTGMGGYIELLNSLGDAVPAKQKDGVRTAVVDKMKAAIAANPEDRMSQRMEGMISYLDGAYMRGKLVDHMAPELTFSWSNHETTLANLGDLKGKVVVLDFWATWCGPCIASIPNVKELVSHYQGYDVEVIGVTSLQGNHYPFGGGAGPISTEGDAAKEYELMKGFIEKAEMSWTIAFSEQEVFNPDYGVRGIPHVAIIDPSGKVRFRGMHPASDLSEKTAKINKLLSEAGLPAPAPLPGEEKASTKTG